MAFSDRVSELLKSHHISQSKMLSDLGLGKNQFSYWKAHGNTPSGDTVNKIAEYFGVSVEYLLGKEDKKSPPPKNGDELIDKFLYLISQLTDEQKQFLLVQMETLLAQQQAKKE